MSERYPAPGLIAFAAALLARAGLEAEKAQVVAEVLVEGDLLGHTTHGLALLPAYLAEIEKGAMAKAGAPRVVADFPAAITWDGKRAMLTDLGSSNGTFVRITGPTTLKNGDHVRMGDQLMRIER